MNNFIKGFLAFNGLFTLALLGLGLALGSVYIEHEPGCLLHVELGQATLTLNCNDKAIVGRN